MALRVGFGLCMVTERTALLHALAGVASYGVDEFVVESLAVDALPMDRPIATLRDDIISEVAYEDMPNGKTF